MDSFEVAFWVTALAGLVALALPAYWLVSGWWKDARTSRDESSEKALP